MSFQIEFITWDDATNIGDWQDVDEVAHFATNGRWKVTNVGVVAFEDDDCVVLAARFTHDGRMFGLSERIPKRSVISRNLALLVERDTEIEKLKAEQTVVREQMQNVVAVKTPTPSAAAIAMAFDKALTPGGTYAERVMRGAEAVVRLLRGETP